MIIVAALVALPEVETNSGRPRFHSDGGAVRKNLSHQQKSPAIARGALSF
jgi:hypothetical protein